MGLSSQQVSGSELDWSHNLSSNVSMEITQQPSGQPRNQQQPQQRQHMPPLKCPRCDSTNTKFCYYNNYSRTQPRHFCKACRRHWTQGGTLRNVPVGGGRKNKRTKTIPTNRNNNSTNSGNNPIITQQQQQQQQQVVVPFGGDHKSEIFPDILRQMLLHSPPPPAVLPSQLSPSDYSFMGSLPFHSPFFPPQLGSTIPTAVSSYNNIVTPPFSISSSSTSPYIYKGQSSLATEEALNTINASTGSAWPGSTSGTGILDSSSGYWSGWDDDVNDLVTPEIKTSMADGSPRP